MLQLRCTKKVLDQFELRPENLDEARPTEAALGNWYVNLTTIQRRKTLIFMSERTLLSFLIFGIRKNSSQDIGELFARGLVQLLELEGFDDNQIASALGRDGLITVTKTNNRSTLGNLNDLIAIYDHCIWYDGGFKHCNLWDIISKTNRMPQRNIGWGYSIDIARELVAGDAARSAPLDT